MTNEEIMKVVKPAICSQLKSPASAQFPVDLISIVGDEERGYQVSGFVDSQNSYGAMIRRTTPRNRKTSKPRSRICNSKSMNRNNRQRI